MIHDSGCTVPYDTVVMAPYCTVSYVLILILILILAMSHWLVLELDGLDGLALNAPLFAATGRARATPTAPQTRHHQDRETHGYRSHAGHNVCAFVCAFPTHNHSASTTHFRPQTRWRWACQDTGTPGHHRAGAGRRAGEICQHHIVSVG